MAGVIEQLQYLGPRKLARREAPRPELDSDRAALVRPIAVATCDLDPMIVAGISPFEGPFALGHECVAEVAEAGDAVHRIRPGQLVSVPFQISCGTCAACARGRTGNCESVERMSTYGFGPAVDRFGGFLSDLVLVPYADHMLAPLPDGVNPEAAASVSDNISDAWRAVAPQLRSEPGAEVLIVGGASSGSIGLYAAGIAVALGSRRVVYADENAHRRAVAETLGAQTFGDPLPRRLGAFPITVDAGATATALACALRSTAPDGVCTSVAIYFGDPPPLPLLEMYTKIISFATGRVHARTVMPEVLRLIDSGALRPELVTTRVVDWDDAADALVEGGYTKLVISRREHTGA